MAAAGSVVMGSLSLKPAPFRIEKAVGLPRLSKNTSFKVVASAKKKLKTDRPYGVSGGMSLRDGLDASGRKAKVRLLPLSQSPCNN